MTSWTIEIPYLTMSMNKRDGAHWAKRAREARQLKVEIGWLCKSKRIPRAAADTRRRVDVDVVKGPRGKRDDPANLPTRAKGILDALVAARVLFDDDDTHLEFDITEHKGESALTRITITDVVAAA